MRINDDRRMQIAAHAVMIFVSLAALLPFVLLVVASFTDNDWAVANGFTFFPKEWSLDAYLYLVNSWETIGRAYLMTVIVTLIGTTASIMITAMFAYMLSKADETPGAKLIQFMLVFTMLFNGGLVATYYTYTSIFHLRDTIWALILPGLLMNAFNVILVRNYFRFSIPESLLEAARIDGAGEFTIFFRIVFPLSKPIIATIGLMTGIMYWNDWQNGLYYLTERNGADLYTIQTVLNTINENINYLSSSASAALTGITSMPSTTARMAIAFIGILPVIIAYPFFQKYFVKGITMGGVKG